MWVLVVGIIVLWGMTGYYFVAWQRGYQPPKVDRAVLGAFFMLLGVAPFVVAAATGIRDILFLGSGALCLAVGALQLTGAASTAAGPMPMRGASYYERFVTTALLAAVCTLIYLLA